VSEASHHEGHEEHEAMRHVPNLKIDRYREVHPDLGPSAFGENWGYFRIDTPNGILRVLASDGSEAIEHGWEHVSVSLGFRCPMWAEMCLVKDLFWDEEETVLQFHPPKSNYVNYHPYTLHLWKQIGVDAKLPPTNLIGPAAQ
jgi:hypothetical protein